MSRRRRRRHRVDGGPTKRVRDAAELVRPHHTTKGHRQGCKQHHVMMSRAVCRPLQGLGVELGVCMCVNGKSGLG